MEHAIWPCQLKVSSASRHGVSNLCWSAVCWQPVPSFCSQRIAALLLEAKQALQSALLQIEVQATFADSLYPIMFDLTRRLGAAGSLLSNNVENTCTNTALTRAVQSGHGHLILRPQTIIEIVLPSHVHAGDLQCNWEGLSAFQLSQR